MAFPTDRPRRLRRTEAMRSFVRETRLSPEGFVYPLFVCPGEGIRKEVRSMPGVYNLSIDEAVKECAEVKSLGIPSVILVWLARIEGRSGDRCLGRRWHRAESNPRH